MLAADRRELLVELAQDRLGDDRAVVVAEVGVVVDLVLQALQPVAEPLGEAVPELRGPRAAAYRSRASRRTGPSVDPRSPPANAGISASA